MKNRLIVESKNDKIFIQALVAKLNIESLDIEAPICLAENDFCLLGGADPNEKRPGTLIKMLKDIKSDILRIGIKKIGVLLDIDNVLEQKRFEMINNAIHEVFGDGVKRKISKTNEFIEIVITPSHSIFLCCYFTNVEKKGNLDTLLKKIANKNSVYADCLKAWRSCLKSNEVEISDSEYDKFWLSNYIRFDTCTGKEKSNANKYCSMNDFERIMQKGIFDLEAECLNDLLDFIRLFK